MALLREYQRKQQQMQRGGFDESVMAELKQLQTELSSNETIQRQQAAQTELVEVLQRTNDAVSDDDRRGVRAINRGWLLLSASDQDAVESEVTDDEIVAVAEALSEELAAAKESSSEFAFTTMVMQCNDAISDETGIDYGSVCGGGADDNGCC